DRGRVIGPSRKRERRPSQMPSLTLPARTESLRMDELVARCPDCGFRHETEFAPCPVCGRPELSHWWCGLCSEWCPRRVCPGCAGLLSAPAEIQLGSAPPGTRVPVRFTVRNAGKKTIELPVAADPVVT